MDVELLYMSFSDPICREILKMRLEGYSVEEIAQHFNLSTRTVERRLQDSDTTPSLQVRFRGFARTSLASKARRSASPLRVIPGRAARVFFV
jgi:DNA-binding NarL/FixJ family response regulator